MRLIKSLQTQAFILALSLNVFFRFQLNWPISSPISTPDSISYRPSAPGPQTFPYEGKVALESLSKIDFFGHSLRPWPVNFYLQILPSDQVITVFNILIGALAWTFLTFSISKLFHSNLYRIIAASLVFIFSLTVYVYNWDKFILSEPIVNSFFVFFIALLINKLSRNTSFTFDYFIITLWLIISISRPVFGLILTPLLFIGEIKYGRRLYFKIILVAILCFYVIQINQNSSEKWLDLMGTSREGLSFSHLSSQEFKNRDTFVSFAKDSGAPDCLFIPVENSGPWNWARSYKDNCPKGVTWLQNEFASKYFYFILDPQVFNKFVLEKSSLTMSGIDFRIYYPYQPFKVSEINNLITLTLWANSYPFFILKLIIFFAFFIYALFAPRKVLNFGLFSIVTLSFIGSILQTALMPTDYERLGLPGSFIFNLFPIVFTLLIFENKSRFISLTRK
jgi:hypothetical protein